METDLIKAVSEFGSLGLLALIIIFTFKTARQYFPELLSRLEEMRDGICDNTESIKELSRAITDHTDRCGNGK